MIDWGLLLLPGAVLLLIPITIVAGFWHSTGSIMASSALAIIAFAAFWLVLGGINGLESGSDPGFPIRAGMLYGGILLTLATWILSLNAAAQARRWVWVGLLLISGYLTLAAIYASSSIQPCSGLGPDGELYCPPPDPLKLALVTVGYFVCPVAALVFSVRAPGRRVRSLPDGLTVSSLHTEPAAEATAAEDAQDAG